MVLKWIRKYGITDIHEVKNLKLSVKIEIDELFGGHKREGKRGGGSIDQKHLVFGLYKRDTIAITFHISDKKHETLISLIKQ